MRYFDQVVITTFDEAFSRLNDLAEDGKWQYRPVALREFHYGKRKAWKFINPYEELALTDTGQIVRAEEPDAIWGSPQVAGVA